MPDQIFRVDTFTHTPCTGTAAAVCLLEEARDRTWMTDLSSAMHVAQVAFILPRGPNRFDMRCTAGGTEIEVAAGATLAAAHVLMSKQLASRRQPITFFTHSGPIAASFVNPRIEMNFPAFQMIELSEPPELVLQAIDPAPAFVGRRGDDFFVQVASERALDRLRPDFAMLRAHKVHGIIATAAAGPSKKHDFAAKTFLIGERRNVEDPLSTVADCLLGPFWFTRLGTSELSELRLEPSGPRRYGLEVDGDRVKIAGEAVTLFEGELKI